MIDIVSETKTTALTGSELANATTAARLLKKRLSRKLFDTLTI